MSQLALLGGVPVRSQGYPPWPQYSDEEAELLQEVLRSRRWFAGARGGDPNSMVSEFGRKFAEYHGVKHALPVMNCSIALELALKAVGVGPGDEVIVPAVTFISTATSVAQVNAIPVVVDIEESSYCMAPDAVERAITSRTRAIIPVHFGGQVADMKSIKALAEQRGIAIIEDAAQAIDSIRWGKHAGSFGKLGCFSFQSNKTITSGEGGLITIDDDYLAERVISLRSFGRRGNEVGAGLLSSMQSWSLSGNYRMTEFQAAVLLAQFARFPEQNSIRQTNASLLEALVSQIPGLRHVKDNRGLDRHGYYYFLIQYDPEHYGGVSCSTLVEALKAEGIPCVPLEPPIYRHPVFRPENWPPKGCPFTCPHYGEPIEIKDMVLPVSERAYKTTIILRHQLLLGDEQGIYDIAEAFEKIREHVGDLEKVDRERKSETPKQCSQ